MTPRSKTLRRWALALLAVVTVAGCSKDNEVDASKNTAGGLGNQCSGLGDPSCGTSGVCVLGYCRLGCLTDGECEQGALCVGDREPYGCQLPDELSCDEEHPCNVGLACGIDGKCRLSCDETSDCPRNEHQCIARTCVSRSEAGADSTWFSCQTGALQCEGDAVWGCNVNAPGYALVPNQVLRGAV